MKRYMVERDIPGIAGLNRTQLKNIAAKCPITGYPCDGDLSHLCEDYGCARKGGLSPRSDEN